MESVAGATGFVPLLTAAAVTLHGGCSAPLVQGVQRSAEVTY